MASDQTQFHDEELASEVNKLAEKIHSQADHPTLIGQFIHGFANLAIGGGLNPKGKDFVEKVVQFLASLSNESKARDLATGFLIKKLWYELEHPPKTLLGFGGPNPPITVDPDLRYRSVDGSNNNPEHPLLGAAGSHYARTTEAKRPKLPNPPSPSDIFNKLLLRTGPAKPHPNGISNMLFYLATIIIHDIFHTDERDPTRAKGSSYLDLAPLYGHNQKEQDGVRAFKDGLLKKDAFAEFRLIGQPPGVCAFIIAFNRFHNYVVTDLAKINENGRFSLPTGFVAGSDAEAAAIKKRDNDLFQHGRLITCGLYINIILNDYIRAILNLNQNPNFKSNWNLDPRPDVPGVNIPKATGNQVSVEFNMIYRWHATINDANTEWTEKFMKKVFGEDYDPNSLTVTQFLAGARSWATGVVGVEPAKREFGGIKRQADGSFTEADLVNLINVATEKPGAAFGARSTPLVMKPIEMLGIQSQRQWGIATLNEVRAKFNLVPHKTFLDVNPDPAVAKALSELYPTPDDIEFYPGIQAEETKKPWFPASGLCPGYTISVAILADAVALCRGDRFYTTDYTEANLTKWGFDIASSKFEKAEGGVFYKLLQNAFPGWYKDNSVWALYPLQTPVMNMKIITSHKIADKFDFKKPSKV
ncbi:heme peroxidase [Acephala macrosclerotiorum]|nr:heme peroxidase [Acephala macrosclerotiorum]